MTERQAFLTFLIRNITEQMVYATSRDEFIRLLMLRADAIIELHWKG